MYLGAGGQLVSSATQPTTAVVGLDSRPPLHGMSACRLTETGYNVLEKFLLLIPTRAIPGRQLRLGILTVSVTYTINSLSLSSNVSIRH
jgi:hypothetical protein